MFDSVVDLVEEHVDLGGSQIFWINCRKLVLGACFTTECGSPGIMKSMSASFTIIGSWFSSWTTMDFSILLRSTSSSTLNVSFSSAERTRELSCAAAVFATSRPASVMSLLNIETLAVFRWTCLNYLCFNKSPCSIWRTEFFFLRMNIDLFRKRTCFSHLACHCASIVHDVVYSSHSRQESLWLLSLGSTSKKNTVMSLARSINLRIWW